MPPTTRIGQACSQPVETRRFEPIRVSALASPEATTATLDWSFLDAVFLITCPNADPGSDRLTKTTKILSDVNLLDKVVVMEFNTDDDDRIRGCYTSHLSVVKEALREADRRRFPTQKAWLQSLLPTDSASSAFDADSCNYNVLILEDNIETSGSLDQLTINTIAQYVTSGKPWDIVQLSYNPYVPNLAVTRTDSNGIVKLSCGVGSALGTTAYVINDEGMRKLVEHDNSRGFYSPIPDVMAELFPESRFAAFPAPFVRAPRTKSLVNPQLDDLRTLLFQPAVASQVQSILVVTGLSTNALLPITIVGLLASTALSGRSTVDAIWSLATTGSFDGPIFLTLLSTIMTAFSLGILAQGIMLAPKPPPESDS